MLTPFRSKLATGILLALVVSFWPLAWRYAAPALSPFLAVGAAIAVRSLGLAAVLGLPMLAWVALRRRFWCRRLCPVGLISESCGKLGAHRLIVVRPKAAAGSWPLARILALATLGGALAGYPLFLWMDPLALFAGFFSILSLQRPEFTPWAVVGFPLLMLVSFLYPGWWCSRLCPLGGTQDLIWLSARFRRGTRQFPAGLATLTRGRRVFLSLGAGALSAAVIPRPWTGRRTRLRPPGAVYETTFQGGCIRCGSCSRACPTGILEPVTERFDAAGFLAPEVRFQGTRYCRQDCNLCGQVCPTGVIRPLALAEKNRQQIGIAVIDPRDCYLAIEKECGVCVPRCPRSALVDVFVQTTYRSEIQILPDRCNGCGACVGICPPKVIRVKAVLHSKPAGRV